MNLGWRWRLKVRILRLRLNVLHLLRMGRYPSD